MASKVKIGMFVLAAATAISSCVDDINLDLQTLGNMEEIYFTASIAEQDFFGTCHAAKTRSAFDEQSRVERGFYDLPVDGRNDLKLSVATLDGMFGKATPIPEVGKANATTRGMLLTELHQQPMSVLEIGKLSDGKTVVGEPYTAYTVDGATWGGSHIERNSNAVSRTLYALYPSSNSYTINSTSRTLSYTTPESATEQSDLLYATKEQSLGVENKDSVHLTFDHILTAVRFKIGSQQLPMSVIKSISIDGIITSGTYNFTNNSWYLSSAMDKVSCDLDFNVTGVQNTIINGGENTFLLLPQQLTPSAKVTIVYEDYTEDDAESQGTKTLTASLATADTPAWEAGQSITYTLMDHDEKNEYILDVDIPSDFSPAGGRQNINVLSYRHVEDKRIPMRWIVQSYSSDGGKTWMSGGASNVPKGMSITPTEGSSSEKTPITVTFFAADTVSAPHRDFLRYKTPLGHDGKAFDLSRHDYLNKPCAQTTANCYVVDAPGKYRIPTAYGNAFVDGKVNTAAYDNKAKYEGAESGCFVDHLGRTITAPMILNNGITLSRATLVWEDVQNLIDPKSIKLVDDGDAIEFEILADNIDQGNAVIAVMDGSNVAWSWHIWITDEKASLATPIEDQNKFGDPIDFMPLTLGWCSTSKAWGAIGREAAVRITMPEYPAKRSSFRIRQNSTPSKDVMGNVIGNSTYYNWGRKDPFPGAVSTEVSPVNDENANALPKPFYQGGADAAELGMHAELHTVYGTNILDLFLQGAISGINGFLTGVTLAKVAKALAAGPKYTVTGVNKEQIPGSFMENPNKFRTWDESQALEAFDMAWNEERGQVDKVFKSLFGEDLTGVRSEWTAIEVSPGVTREGYLVFKDNIPMYFYGVFEQNPGFGDFVVYMTTVRTTSNAGILFFGSFAGVMFQVTRQFGIHNATYSDVVKNSSLFRGGTEWCKEIKSHGVPVNYGILHPNILMRDPISWINHDGVGNLWNTAQTKYDDMEEKVVKTIYDPCPAGYCVPSARDMSGLEDLTTRVDFAGSTVKTVDRGGQIAFPSLGCRNFWDASEPGAAVTNNINEMIFLNGDQGFYWTASPAINHKEEGEKGAYAVNFRGSTSYDNYGDIGVQKTPRVVNDLKLQHSFALPVRPVRERR